MNDLCCRACYGPGTRDDDLVLDLGPQARTSHLSRAGEPVELFALAMWLCPECGLAQLADDAGPEPQQQTVEPQALTDHGREAVAWLIDRGHLVPGEAVREHRSPHGGSWLGHLLEAGAVPVGDDDRSGTERADVVVDSLGLMHAPDQAAAIEERLAALADGGRLVLMVHTLGAIVAGRQWNDLRHGHYAYWSLAALAGLLERNGLVVVDAFEHVLYGGTVVLV
ncbi:MAG: methyltransferase domain-containing protein, partial [Propionibacteriales bacterium]|nr:methyltransferase domain-containing protein [Propionibacteriales bacterium]